MVDCGFRFLCVALGERAVEGKGGFFSRPVEKKKPGFFAPLEKHRGELGSGNDNRGLEIRFHREDLFLTNEKLNRNGSGQSGAEFRSVQSQSGAGYRSHFVFRTRSHDRRQQDCREEKGQAENRGDPALR